MQIPRFVVRGKVLQRSNKAVSIVYDGKVRFIRIKSINISKDGNGYLHAHDIRKGLNRNFSVDKIDSVIIH